MRRRGWTVVAACCALLVSLAGAASETSLDERRPADAQRTPPPKTPSEPCRPTHYNGPPECNPIRGSTLPKHCRTSQTTNVRNEDNPRNGVGRDGIYRGPPECNPIRAQTLPEFCKLFTIRPSDPVRPRRPVGGVRENRAFPVPTSTAHAASADEDEDEDEDVYVPFSGKRLDAFDWRLVHALDAVARTNAVVSPVGVKLVLGLLHEAASQASATELRDALGLPAARPSARGTFRNLLQTLQENREGYIMKVGNRVYLHKEYEPRSSILNVYKSYYSAEIERVDFTAPALVKPIINRWVSNFTNGLIKQLVTNDRQVENLISMILNVIYFKGEWLYPFSKLKSSKGPFYVNSENTVMVDYMYITRDLYFCESEKLDSKLLRLPYKGKKYSMFFILPNKKHDLNRTIQLITPDLIREQLHSLNKTEVKVKIPKFIFQYTVHLKELLQKVGISRIFTHSDEINLTKNKTNMMISKVIQKVGLEINEEGTEATSVTEVDLTNHFGGPQMFVVNHPFLFFVEEEKTGTIVFIGKVIDPSYVKTSQNSTSAEKLFLTRDTDVLVKDFSKDILVQPNDTNIPPVAPPEL